MQYGNKNIKVPNLKLNFRVLKPITTSPNIPDITEPCKTYVINLSSQSRSNPTFLAYKPSVDTENLDNPTMNVIMYS